MLSQNILKSKNFLIYGLGLTGRSVCQFLKKSKTKIFFYGMTTVIYEKNLK